MESLRERKRWQLILSALKMRMYLSLGFGYSRLFPARDALLIRADKKARRQATFLQRLPARIVIFTTVGAFCYFFATENKAGLISVLYLLPPLIIPVAVLLGALITTKADSIDVCLRREYARLSADPAPPVSRPDWAVSRRGIDERMRDRRVNWYQETSKILRQSKGHNRAR